MERAGSVSVESPGAFLPTQCPCTLQHPASMSPPPRSLPGSTESSSHPGRFLLSRSQHCPVQTATSFHDQHQTKKPQVTCLISLSLLAYGVPGAVLRLHPARLCHLHFCTGRTAHTPVEGPLAQDA